MDYFQIERLDSNNLFVTRSAKHLQQPPEGGPGQLWNLIDVELERVGGVVYFEEYNGVQGYEVEGLDQDLVQTMLFDCLRAWSTRVLSPSHP